jgi:hypothetical protein
MASLTRTGLTYEQVAAAEQELQMLKEDCIEARSEIHSIRSAFAHHRSVAHYEIPSTTRPELY